MRRNSHPAPTRRVGGPVFGGGGGRRGRHALDLGAYACWGRLRHLWFPARDAAFASDAVADAVPAVGAITAARVQHFFQTYIYAQRDTTPSRKAAIDKDMAAAPRDALARSVSNFPYRFWVDRRSFSSVRIRLTSPIFFLDAKYLPAELVEGVGQSGPGS